MNSSYKTWLLILTFLLVGVHNSLAEESGEKEAIASKRVIVQKQDAANTQLESITKLLATAIQKPGFRGFIRSQIAQSKNRENIVDLSQILNRASGKPESPPGLDKLKTGVNKVRETLKNKEVWGIDGLDLYLPVAEHRKKWKGNEDLLVAYAPVTPDNEIMSIVAYSVKSGKRVLLDPNVPPDTPVLVIAPEEHEDHKVVTPPDAPTPPPADNRKNPASQPFTEKQSGNSRFYIKWLKLYRDQEPWTRGDPEIYVLTAQRQGSNCANKQHTSLGFVNDTYRWYYTYNYLKSYFDNTYSDPIYYRIMESDGGDYQWLVINMGGGATCGWYIRSGDDYVDSRYLYKSTIQWDYDTYQSWSYSSVYMRKTH